MDEIIQRLEQIEKRLDDIEHQVQESVILTEYTSHTLLDHISSLNGEMAEVVDEFRDQLEELFN